MQQTKKSVSIAFTVAAIAIGSAIHSTVPNSTEVFSQPFVHTVDASQLPAVVEIPDEGTFSLERWGLFETLEDEETAGVYLVAEFKVKRERPAGFRWQASNAKGERFSDVSFFGGDGLTNFDAPVETAFEIVPDSLEGFTISLTDKQVVGPTAYSETVFDLGITKDMIPQIVAETQGNYIPPLERKEWTGRDPF